MCCKKLLPRDEFSKKQWGRADEDEDRRCKECIEENVPLQAPLVFGPGGGIQTTMDASSAASAADASAATASVSSAASATVTSSAAAKDAEQWWLAWRLPKLSASLLHPTALNLRSILISLHRQLEPWLLGDMVRRSPGKGASSDGTFRLMMRTRTDGTVELPPVLPSSRAYMHTCMIAPSPYTCTQHTMSQE